MKGTEIMLKGKMYTDYIFDKDTMRALDIPEIPLIDDRQEVWRYCWYDRQPDAWRDQRYMVSNYGRVYDKEKHRIVPFIVSDFFKSAVSGYIAYYLTLRSDDGSFKKFTYYAHRLVMMAFTLPSTHKAIVNHIDGNPSHNYLWNLEWTSASENYIHALKTGLKHESIGEERANAKWTDEEVHLICRLMAQGHKATFIYNYLKNQYPDNPKIQYERVRTLVKHIKQKTHWTHISNLYNINTEKFNYSKETGSVKAVQDRLKEQTPETN